MTTVQPTPREVVAPEPADSSADSAAEALDRLNRRLAATAVRIAALENERDEWRTRYTEVVAQRDALLAGLGDLSVIERLVLLLVTLVRNPRVGVYRVGRAIRRRLRLDRVLRALRRRPRPTPATPSPGSAGLAGARKQASSPAAAPRSAVVDHLPVYAYLAFGYDLSRLRALAQVVSQAALVTGDHVPLIVTDCVGFSQLRDIAVVVEYVPDRTTWESHRTADPDWEVFRRTRVAQIMRAHAVARVMQPPPDRIPDLSTLLELHPAPLDPDM